MNDLDELERKLGPRLRSTFDACFSEDAFNPTLSRQGDSSSTDEHAVTRAPHPPLAGSRGRGRVLVGAAAAASVAVGLAGVAALSGRNDRVDVPTAPLSSPAVEQPPTTILSEDATPTTIMDSITADADAAVIALPSFVPDDYVLDDISVTQDFLSLAGRPAREQTRYVRRIDGQIEVLIRLTSQPLYDDFDTGAGSITVHGQHAQIFDNGGEIQVIWAERDQIIDMSAQGLSWDESAEVAEQTVVDPGTGAVSLPQGSGFDLAELPPAPSAEAAMTRISYRAAADQGDRISIARWPNFNLGSLELTRFRLARQGWTIEPTTVQELPAIIATPPTNEASPPLLVQWFDDDGMWSVNASLAADVVVDIADGLQPATLDQARQLRAELDVELAALPELDRAKLPNGFELSIHSVGNGAGVVCIHQPERRCHTEVSESSLIGEYQSTIITTFWIAGQPWMIGWAEGEHQPTLFTADGSTDPVAEVVDGSVVVAGTAGTFIAVPSPPEDLQFSFGPGAFPVYPAPITGDTNLDLLG